MGVSIHRAGIGDRLDCYRRRRCWHRHARGLARLGADVMALINGIVLAFFGGVMAGGTLAAASYGHATDAYYAVPIAVLCLGLAVLCFRRA